MGQIGDLDQQKLQTAKDDGPDVVLVGAAGRARLTAKALHQRSTQEGGARVSIVSEYFRYMQQWDIGLMRQLIPSLSVQQGGARCDLVGERREEEIDVLHPASKVAMTRYFVTSPSLI